MHARTPHPGAAPAVGAEPLLLPDAASPSRTRLILSKSEDPAFRRMWIRRIRDHDGDEGGEAGLELWLQLADGVGLDREEVAQLPLGPSRRALRVRRLRGAGARAQPGRGGGLVADGVLRPRSHVQARAGLGEALSLGEPGDCWQYFRSRVPRARRDSEEAIDFVIRHATTYEHAGALRGGPHPQDGDPLAPAGLHVRRLHRPGLGPTGPPAT